jgi:hypothetical protein
MLPQGRSRRRLRGGQGVARSNGLRPRGSARPNHRPPQRRNTYRLGGRAANATRHAQSLARWVVDRDCRGDWRLALKDAIGVPQRNRRNSAGPPSRLTNCVESRGPKRLTGPQLNGCIRRDGGFGDTWTEREMRPLTVAMLLCLSAAAAQAGLLSTVSACAACRIAPAPEIGSGLPVALAIGGVLLATRLLAHWRRS